VGRTTLLIGRLLAASAVCAAYVVVFLLASGVPHHRLSSVRRKQLQSFAVAWSDDGEVTLVEGNDHRGAESLSKGDHRCVGTAKRKVAVLVDKLGDAIPVVRTRRLDLDPPEPAETPRR
jgi:hypothetical protein